MEHIFFQPDDLPKKQFEEERDYACDEPILKSTWEQMEGLVDFIPPLTPWQGFDHGAVAFVGNLEDYPTAAGYDPLSLWTLKFQDAHKDFKGLPKNIIGQRVVTLFQSWLYLGFLENIVGKKIEASYMTRQHSNGQTYLYSRNLYFCMLARFLRNTSQPTIEQARKIQDSLGLVCNWVNRFVFWSRPGHKQLLDDHYPGMMDALDQTIPAIVRLTEAVQDWSSTHLADTPLPYSLSFNRSIPAREKVMKDLEDLGWCPYQAWRMIRTLNNSAIDWIVACEIKESFVGHETCTRTLCNRDNIDRSKYEQTHTSECNRAECGKIFPDLKTVEDILRDDKIPVISLKMEEGSPQLSVSARSKQERGDYFALSHVWSDGLGGDTKQGLNKCQAKRLAKICKSANNEDEDTYFWLDSLCIPREDKDVFFKALIGIRDAYICAATVLVLDRRIEACTLETPTETLLGSIYLSAWMSRMWTYEEAVLADKLVFVVTDGFRTYTVGSAPTIPWAGFAVWCSLISEIDSLYTKGEGNRTLNIGHIYSAFRYRLTNATQEEFLSISGILGLDTSTLIKFEGDERTKQFWLMLKWIPFNVPFLNGPKLTDEGFRWAPQTLMNPSNNRMSSKEEDATSECTAEGLIGTYTMATLQSELKLKSNARCFVFVWRKEKDTTLVPEFNGVLKIEFDPYPSGADEHEFHAIMFQPQQEMRNGDYVAGIALARQNSAANSVPKFKYVGRLVVELASFESLFDERRKDLKFDEANFAARALWSTENVCIT